MEVFPNIRFFTHNYSELLFYIELSTLLDSRQFPTREKSSDNFLLGRTTNGRTMENSSMCKPNLYCYLLDLFFISWFTGIYFENLMSEQSMAQSKAWPRAKHGPEQALMAHNCLPCNCSGQLNINSISFLVERHVERRGRMVRTSDSQPEDHGFESRRRHGVVSVSRIP
jgi:hypothetical protein